MLRSLIATFICMLFIISCKKDKEQLHPYVSFTYSGNMGVVPVTVQFKCNLSSPYVIYWDFGDGSVAEGSEVSHTYLKQGFFTVYAKAISDEGIGEAMNYVNVSPYNKINIYKINGGVGPLQPNGATWDPEHGATNPDLYFKIFNSQGMEMSNTGYPYVPEVLSTQYPINPVVPITDFDGYFTVYFLDYDFGYPSDDTVGIYKFRPADYFRDSLFFPDHFVMNDTTTNASINVNVFWAN